MIRLRQIGLKHFGRKGDTDRFMLWLMILLIMLILIVALFYSGAYNIIKGVFLTELIK
jgi:hypothetical protein